MSTEQTLPATAPTFKDKARLVAIGLVLGLVIGAAGALKVYLNASGEIGARDDTILVLQGSAAQLGARNSLLQVRVHLARGLMELDGQNFGTANAQIAEAARVLSAIQPNQLAVNPTTLAETQERLGRAKVDVGLDVTAQRADLVNLILSVDQLIGQ